MPFYIPKEFQKSHGLCFFLHDQLVTLLKSGEEAEIFHNTIAFDSEEEAQEFSALSGEELIDWLRGNGREKDAALFLKKQVTTALLSDFLHFVYEGLKCSEKQKLTVAFALFRKPFRDNLFYFEWLLADSEEFLRRFETDGQRRFSFPQKDKRERMVDIICKASHETRYGDWHNAESLWELRYDRSTFGLDAYWNMATHLHTHYSHIEIEAGNFNFVFSNDEDIHSQWETIYSVIPVLLFQALQVVEAIILGFSPPPDFAMAINQLRTDIGMTFWFVDHAWGDEWDKLHKALIQNYGDIELTCQACRAPVQLDEPNLRLVYEDAAVKCTSCGQVLSLDLDT